MLRNWLKALFAVLLGNLIYLLVLMPHLPAAGRHRPNHLDWGLVVDFWVCLALYGVIDWIIRKFRAPARPVR